MCITTVNEHAVFALAGNIAEADVFYRAAFGLGVSVKAGEYNRLRCAPPVRAEPSGFYDAVRIGNIFHIAAVANLNGKPPVAAGDDAAAHQNIAEIPDALCANLNGGGGGN